MLSPIRPMLRHVITHGERTLGQRRLQSIERFNLGVERQMSVAGMRHRIGRQIHHPPERFFDPVIDAQEFDDDPLDAIALNHLGIDEPLDVRRQTKLHVDAGVLKLLDGLEPLASQNLARFIDNNLSIKPNELISF